MQKRRRMKQTRTVAEFWSPLFAQTQVTYLTFVCISNLTNTFGRNLLYWIL
jgi:hypothetical protein